jgi:hypothetical protein
VRAILAVVDDPVARRESLTSAPIDKVADYFSKIDPFPVSRQSGRNGVHRRSRSRELVEQALRIRIRENTLVGIEIIRPFDMFVLLPLVQAIVVPGRRISWDARRPRPAEGKRRRAERIDGPSVAAIFLRRLLAQIASFRIELIGPRSPRRREDRRARRSGLPSRPLAPQTSLPQRSSDPVRSRG